MNNQKIQSHPRWLAPFASLLFICLGAMISSPSNADGITQTGVEKVHVQTITDELNSPWSLAFLPDGRMLVTEKPGSLRIIENGKLVPQPVAGVPKVVDSGQGGLLDVALHPRYSENGWIYLTYSARGQGGSGLEVFRGKLAGNQLVEGKVIFRQSPKINSNKHFGSRIVFDREGYLYVTMGERGEQDRAQKLGEHIGKVVRLMDDGTVPKDNPFIGKAGALPEIYSYGHRNVQGAAIHPVTGAIWTNEHGPQGGDEINILKAGTNYGWPVITYGVNYFTGTKIGEGTHKPGMAQPLYKWVPSIAPSSMAFYTGDKFPGWKGSLFVGSMKFQTLVRLTLDGDRVASEERLLDGIGRLRDVRQGPDGLLYLLTSDRLLQLQPAP
ncbi:Aldose sugar dehydrogenase YliI [Methylophilaceae bacterium]|nr:Aldose sugar dehydrogenase YliI [Methylophilaceae bacterium]